MLFGEVENNRKEEITSWNREGIQGPREEIGLQE